VGGATVGPGKGQPAGSSPSRQGIAEPGRWRLPPGVTATLDLAADSVSWRQRTARQVRLEAALAGGNADIKPFSALLPGGTEVAIVGAVDTVTAAPRFAGTVRANADNLRELLRWGGIELEGVPADRLRRATISGRLAVDNHFMEVQALDATFDASHLTG